MNHELSSKIYSNSSMHNFKSRDIYLRFPECDGVSELEPRLAIRKQFFLRWYGCAFGQAEVSMILTSQRMWILGKVEFLGEPETLRGAISSEVLSYISYGAGGKSPH
jgi:hypothetical protein